MPSPLENWQPHPLGQNVDSRVVLVVDDEVLVRNFVCRVLENAGYVVLAAGDGEEALEVSRAFRGKIHVLVSDVVMPRLDGIALRERILRERPALQVLLVSGTVEKTREGLEVLRKPFPAEALKARVLQLLRAGEAGLA